MSPIPNGFYVYAHYRKSDNSPFYVGKGKGYRFNNQNRSAWWRRIAEKHGWYSRIIKENLSERCALSLEKVLIHIHKSKLCNLTNGGDGTSGYKFSKECIEAKRQKMIGGIVSDETKVKQSIAKKGKKLNDKQAVGQRIGTLKAAENRKKPVISSDGRIFPSGTDAEIARASEGFSAGYQGEISRCAQGLINNACGLTWSYDLSIIPDYRKNSYNSQEIKCIDNGMIFDSAREATSWVSLWRGSANHQCITWGVRTGKRAYGLAWEWTEKGRKAVRIK